MVKRKFFFFAKIINPLFNRSNLCEQSANSQTVDDQLNQKHARSLLTLAKWIESATDRPNHSSLSTPSISKLLSQASSLIPFDKFNLRRSDLHGCILETNIRHVGDLFDLATAVGPRQSKAWYHLADWSFRRAQPKTINFDLTEIVPLHTSSNEKDLISSLFSGQLIHDLMGKNLSEGSEVFQSDGSLETIIVDEIKLLLEDKCLSLDSDSIKTILDVYQTRLRNSTHLNKVACNSYFTFLKLGDMVKILIFVLNKILN